MSRGIYLIFCLPFFCCWNICWPSAKAIYYLMPYFFFYSTTTWNLLFSHCDIFSWVYIPFAFLVRWHLIIALPSFFNATTKHYRPVVVVVQLISGSVGGDSLYSPAPCNGHIKHHLFLWFKEGKSNAIPSQTARERGRKNCPERRRTLLDVCDVCMFIYFFGRYGEEDMRRQDREEGLYVMHLIAAVQWYN